MINAPLRIASLALALGLGSPAAGQGSAVFPPVPGPFIATPLMPQQINPGYAPARPQFQQPANALRLPYWMQQPSAGSVAQAPSSGVTTPTIEPGATQGGETVTTGFDQRTAPGAYPPHATPGTAPAYPAPGQMQVAPGVGVQPQGWAYGVPPGWSAGPYMPQPGWGGGYVQPGGRN